MKKRFLLNILVMLLVLSLFSYTTFAETNNIYEIASSVQKIEANKIRKCDKPFSMIWITDTQYYSESHPEIFDFLGDWFVQEYKRGSFGYLINTGDLVNVTSNENQWIVASRNFKKLDDANIPYGILPGNHDIINYGARCMDYRNFFKYFGAFRYKNRPWYRGNTDSNRNHYDIISFGTHDFIILYLGYSTNIDKRIIDWSNKVLKTHANKTAIIAMHEYLNDNSTMTKTAQTVFNNIIMKNDNVMIVLCGHNHGCARNIKTVANSDGSSRQVLEILSDYQRAPNGGDGYLRYLIFHPASETLCVETYSPYKNAYNFFKAENDSFVEKIKLRD